MAELTPPADQSARGDRDAGQQQTGRREHNHWKIVVGFDGSPPAQQALSWALDAANAFDAEVVAVHAVGLLETQHAALDDDESPHTPGEDRVTRLARAMQRRIDEVGRAPAVRLVMEPGAPADALLRAAGDEAADLIVVGRRGSGEPYQLGLGSVSRTVAGQAVIPVVVVPTRG